MQTAGDLLKVERLGKTFGSLAALQEFSCSLQAGEIVGLIGPNGAGKTTCFNLLTGFLIPTAGTISFRGTEITGAPPARVAHLGIARTFQNIRLFSSLTVAENVQCAAQLRTPTSLWETLTSASSFAQKEKTIRTKALELLELLNLAQFADQPASSLPYGNQRRLEIARALATEPSLLLLDEPAAGMNPAESAALHQLILEIRNRFHLAILLVEHDMKLVMNLCERIIVLNYGKVIAQGKPEEVRRNPEVVEAYLGSSVNQ